MFVFFCSHLSLLPVVRRGWECVSFSSVITQNDSAKKKSLLNAFPLNWFRIQLCLVIAADVVVIVGVLVVVVAVIVVCLSVAYALHLCSIYVWSLIIFLFSCTHGERKRYGYSCRVHSVHHSLGNFRFEKPVAHIRRCHRQFISPLRVCTITIYNL